MSELTPSTESIYREQVNTVFGFLPLLLWVDITAGCVLVSFIYLSTDNYTSFMFPWFAAMLTLSALRLFSVRRMQFAAAEGDQVSAKVRLLFICTIITGLIWGTTWSIPPFQTVEPPRGAVTLWPFAILAAAVANLAVLKRLYFSLTIITFGCHIGFLLIQGITPFLQLTIAYLVYGVIILIVANRISDDLKQGIILKLQNRMLSDILSRDKIILKENEQTLFEQIEREKALLEEKRNADSKLALAAAEKLQLLESAGEGIFGTNSNGQITFINSMALKLLNYSEKDVLGQDTLAIISRHNSTEENKTRKMILACFHEGKSATSVRGEFFGKKDILIPVNFSCLPIIKEDKFAGAVISFFDMTEQMEMERRLTLAQKMEAIGRITGGVAHDFNNLLTAFQGNLQFLKKRLKDGDLNGGTMIIDKLLQAAKRGADLNNRLLSYSREQALHNNPEDIGEILLEMQDFLKRTLGEDIGFELQIDGIANYAMIDRSRFENIILNVCLNAKDAMPDGGSLQIKCHRLNTPIKNATRAKNSHNSGHVAISITDTGTGIPLEIQDKIFDPFFTTKAPGEGTGFGLSTGFGFVQQSGGTITVQSKVGAGATFVIQLPAIPHSEILKQTSQEPANDERKHNGTILVVEDDADVREVATLMLLDAGYKVITASNGPEGLDKFRKHSEINLIFSDIVMPGGMTGIEMARKMLELDPQLPIILATGYTEKMLKDRIEGIGNVICIAKPYDTEKLPETIDSMLSTKTGTHHK